MTQPFPMVRELESTKYLSTLSSVGVAHNGIIRLTTDPNEIEYSDTALFVSMYLPDILQKKADLKDKKVLDKIEKMIQSKMVILDWNGDIALIGDFVRRDGLLFSNYSFQDYTYSPKYFTLEDVKHWRKVVGFEDVFDDEFED